MFGLVLCRRTFCSTYSKRQYIDATDVRSRSWPDEIYASGNESGRGCLNFWSSRFDTTCFGQAKAKLMCRGKIRTLLQRMKRLRSVSLLVTERICVLLVILHRLRTRLLLVSDTCWEGDDIFMFTCDNTINRKQKYLPDEAHRLPNGLVWENAYVNAVVFHHIDGDWLHCSTEKSTKTLFRLNISCALDEYSEINASNHYKFSSELTHKTELCDSTAEKFEAVWSLLSPYFRSSCANERLYRVTQKDVYPWKFQLWLWLKSYLFQITTTHYSVYGRPFTRLSTISVDF